MTEKKKEIKRKKRNICALEWVKNKPGGHMIDTLFKRPLTLHTQL